MYVRYYKFRELEHNRKKSEKYFYEKVRFTLPDEKAFDKFRFVNQLTHLPEEPITRYSVLHVPLL